MTIVVTCDPGKNHCGLSLWFDSRLIAVTVIKVKKAKDIEGAFYRQGRLPLVECQLPTLVSHEAAGWLATFNVGLCQKYSVSEYVGEMPQVYHPKTGKKTKVDPEDLLFVQSTNQAIAVVTGANRVRFVMPSEHKGQVDPAVYWERVENKLSPEEKPILVALKKKFGTGDRSGHGIDSVGVGLWAHWRSA